MTHDGQTERAIINDGRRQWAIMGRDAAGYVVVAQCDDTGEPIAGDITTKFDSVLTLVYAAAMGLRPLG